eukprot:8445624-Pyramimonas_sp.AAC.1
MHHASQQDADKKALQTASKAPGTPQVTRCQFKDIHEKEEGPSGSAGSPAEPAAASASAETPA